MTRKLLACTLLTSALSFGAAHAATTTINAGGSSLAYPTYTAEFAAYTKANPSIKFSYAAAGSGAGQNGFIKNLIGYFQPVSSTNTIGYAAGTLTYGTIVGTAVDLGASDAFLTSSQLTNPATGSYTSSATSGPLIQLPTFGTPITMAFNQTAISGDALNLNDAQICGILSGKITDWHTLVAAIPAGTTINVTYRSDSSGTTFLLTQHLNAVCNATNSNFPVLPVAITKTFASLFNTTYPVPANFTAESGSGGVSSHMVATANSFGYLSPDYTSIAPKSTNKTTLQVASVYNSTNKKYYLPTYANTVTGLANAGAGSTNATPPSTLTAAMNPLNWVPAIPTTKSGYPIVGYTTMDVSSCYANKTVGTAINTFLTQHYTNTSYKTLVLNGGFAPISTTAAAPYATAIVNDFLSNTSGYNLNINNATTCASYAGR